VARERGSNARATVLGQERARVMGGCVPVEPRAWLRSENNRVPLLASSGTRRKAMRFAS
jgi:hypothetical protein